MMHITPYCTDDVVNQHNRTFKLLEVQDISVNLPLCVADTLPLLALSTRVHTLWLGQKCNYKKVNKKYIEAYMLSLHVHTTHDAHHSSIHSGVPNTLTLGVQLTAGFLHADK